MRSKRTTLLLAAAIVLITLAALLTNTFKRPAPATQQNGSTSTANASVMGYGGPVLVRLTVDAQGRITALDVGGARFNETEGVGSRVKDESFLQPFLGLKPPLTLGREIDAISGATISSTAVVDAVNEAAAFLSQNDAAFDTN